ncbi:MAG: chromosomal replication initiator protein DnaA [Verrucomicrobiota bacterium]|nr:chromosomal replication initiator protein DnaA [Chthoniobacterales bacterium]MDQ3625864.1 chromosomal replication initiator protein DnaA [Verrucomicrobiota bacterium]
MDEKCAEVWQQLSTALKPHVSADTYKRWFSAVRLVNASDDAFTFLVPNNIYQFWIESNHMAALQAAIVTTFGEPRAVKFVMPADALPVGAGDVAEPIEVVEPEPDPVRDAKSSGSPAGLNPRNTFESFVVGPNNEIAHAASLAVAQSPARTYNPLFIYGGVGLGKTHLMQAIGQYVWSKKKNAKVMYLSSELFINEFIDAIQHSTLVKFRKRYRQADLLLIDDIQFLGGKERSQEEFFHTFNTLFDGHKQIVLSSDRPASEIANLEHRLVSRFEWGLTAELQPPDVETRTAILRKKARTLHINLRDEIFDFLANRIRTNVRRLEGALMRVASFASLSGKELTSEVIEHLLKDILNEEARHAVTIEQIQRKVAEHFDVRIADMTSKRRPANIAFPRQIAMYLARELTKASLNEIGEAFGGRDHGTVLHACKLVKKRMIEQDNIRQTVSFIDSSLQR